MSKSDEQNVTPAFDPLLPARINIANWGTPVLASTIRFPMSEEGWLNEGRQRRSKFAGKQGVVYWHLVEPSDSVPENAIGSGSEYSVQVYSIRAWHEGGLTLGKLSTQVLFWRSKRKSMDAYLSPTLINILFPTFMESRRLDRLVW